MRDGAAYGRQPLPARSHQVLLRGRLLHTRWLKSVADCIVLWLACRPDGCFAVGLIHAEVTLSNPRRRDGAPAPMAVRALVDTGAANLCIPAHIALQLELEELERREVTTADGKATLVPYVGPVQVRFVKPLVLRRRVRVGRQRAPRVDPVERHGLGLEPAARTGDGQSAKPEHPFGRGHAFDPADEHGRC